MTYSAAKTKRVEITEVELKLSQPTSTCWRGAGMDVTLLMELNIVYYFRK